MSSSIAVAELDDLLRKGTDRMATLVPSGIVWELQSSAKRKTTTPD